MSDKPRTYAEAVAKRHEVVEAVRFWFYLWYVVGEGPEALLGLLGKSDDEIWDQWRDLAEIDALIAGTWTPENPRPNPWPHAHAVAKAMIAPELNKGEWLSHER